MRQTLFKVIDKFFNILFVRMSVFFIRSPSMKITKASSYEKLLTTITSETCSKTT